MKTPESLASAVDCGVIQEVVRPLMSGKEAQVYVVYSGGVECVAKVYKEASQRTFKHRSEYTEGRRTRNSRDQRAVGKRSRHGKAQDEAGWRSTEVDMICRLQDAGVRVPEFINFIDGILVMEFVKDADGDPAPRLGDVTFSAGEARTIYKQLLREVSRMLCAGVIHGDLSEFNVLMGVDGPVVIDFPQSMEAARNQGARKFLLRDVANLHRFVERYAPLEPTLAYGEEMWELYETNRLHPDTELRGDYQAPDDIADTGEVLALIEDAGREEDERREARGEAPRAAAAVPGLRRVVDFTPAPKPRPKAKPKPKAPAKATGKAKRSKASPERGSQTPGEARDAAGAGTKKRRNRRGRKKAPTTGSSPAAATGAALNETAKPGRGANPDGATGGDTQPRKRRRRGGRNRSRNKAAGGASPATPASAETAESPKTPGTGGAKRKPAQRRRRRPRSGSTPKPS